MNHAEEVGSCWPVLENVTAPMRDANGRLDEAGVRKSRLTFYVTSGVFNVHGLSGKWAVGVDGSIWISPDSPNETSVSGPAPQFLFLLQDLIPLAVAAHLRRQEAEVPPQLEEA